MLRKVDDRPHSATRILIVEDDGDTAESMARLLTILGYEVAIARDGLHAIAMAPRQGPDFVLLDLGLPGMDGYQIALSLKQEVECKKTVFIAVTGYGQSEDRQRSRAAGIDHHLVKPVDPDVLLGLLARCEAGSVEGDARRQPLNRSADDRRV
jgi:two-component system CheB/CheR fusion protein